MAIIKLGLAGSYTAANLWLNNLCTESLNDGLKGTYCDGDTGTANSIGKRFTSTTTGGGFGGGQQSESATIDVTEEYWPV